MANITYNRIIRKMVVAFGNLFNDITLVRYNKDLTEQERLIVPIAYAPKELYVMRLEEDPDLDKKVQMTLPRISFEMTDLKYDATRKTNTNIKTFAQTPTGVVSQYNPVPYDFHFSLYIYVRNIEDGAQIIEHILPYFTPDYTVKVNLIPEMGTVKEIPVILNDATQDITYEGGKEWEPRMIIWTLTFTVKGFIFGGISPTGGLIKQSITNVLSSISAEDTYLFTVSNVNGYGTYKVGEIVYQGYSLNTATATAKVLSFNNNNLILTNIDGNFVSDMPIKSTLTNASYYYTSFNPESVKMATVEVKVKPPTANVTDNWTANTTILEFPFTY